jgi:hypothetical protein
MSVMGIYRQLTLRNPSEANVTTMVVSVGDWTFNALHGIYGQDLLLAI